MNTITLSAAQITCKDGKVSENLEHAGTLALQASQQGAQLLLFPEFMSQGYRLTPELWDSAEPFDGPTTNWLSETARKLGMYIGTSFLEAKDCHFLNTFALAEPSGKIVGAVRKRNPSIWEAYFFRGERGNPYLDTDLGRIGVGICFDNHTYEVASDIARGKIDLMLMPHSYCTPTLPTKITSQADIDRLNNLPVRVARLYNEWFGVPVVLCNKSGPWDSPVPNTMLGVPTGYHFSGRSLIFNANGALIAELGEDEAVITGQVDLDETIKKQVEPSKYGRYIYPGSFGREILRIIETAGALNYTYNSLRNQKARQALG